MINKVILIGNLGKDPEVRHFDNNNVVANFPIATSESYIDKDGKRTDKTEWHNIVAWRKLGEIAEQYLKKGKQVYVEGKLQTRSYDDKDGNKRYITEVVADTIKMLGKKDDDDYSGSNDGSYSRQAKTAEAQNGGRMEIDPEMDDDLPF